jgi:putative tricarboxylic transport membrane protein
MRLNDALLGGLLIVLAAALAFVARGFPAVPGQDYGAAAFPTLIAAGFAGCGLVLIGSGLKHRAPLVEWHEWTRHPRRGINIAAIVGAVIFYILAVDRLGFILTMALILVALLRRFGTGWGLSLALAIAVPIVMQYLFGTLLLVPLPWGPLAPFRWS